MPVLREAVLGWLAPMAGGVMLDATLGLGGHAGAMLPLLGPGGTLVGLDRDAGQIALARERLAEPAERHGVRLELVHGDFAEARDVLHGMDLRADRVLADLGFASNQVDDAARGLSFQREGPLDMRLDPTRGPTAAELVAKLGERELADVLFELGEERLSRRIARKIVERRGSEPIQTTRQLASLVRSAYGSGSGPRGRRQRIDPATRTFQALRIAVNDELASLDRLLRDVPTLVSAEARVGVISFHSLEDRRVKRAFAEWEERGMGKRATRKPVTAEAAEARDNPRSRSAKLRVFTFAAASGP
ncbi:MAG: 16S rRNA (cytosine(1402)-N(4))-methyltransferase RsmH [Phycisphaeraceae bacterium]